MHRRRSSVFMSKTGLRGCAPPSQVGIGIELKADLYSVFLTLLTEDERPAGAPPAAKKGVGDASTGDGLDP